MDLYKNLLGVETHHDYLQYLLEPLAQKYTDRGKYPEAVYVYELSGVNILILVHIKESGD
jgi:hypothetical protein